MATVVHETEQGHDDGGVTPPLSDEPQATADAPTRPCGACGAAMSPEQDWCFACGTARPGRLGARPGWRAATTVSIATTLLVAGAVAASYAALTNDAGRKASAPAGASATPVAQAPVAVPAPTPTPTSPVTVQTPPFTPPAATTTATTLPALPKLPTTSTPVTSTPVTTTPTTTTTTTATTTTTTTTHTTTTPVLTPITLGADAADIYDPYQRVTAKGDPADAADPRAGSPWFVTTPVDTKPMQVGLLVDLESKKTVKQVTFATTTPGFRVEVYVTDSTALPPDILDTRWTHVASRSKVDQDTKATNVKGDGKEIIAIPSTAPKVAKLVLWFTTPPDNGPTVKLRDLVLKG